MTASLAILAVFFVIAIGLGLLAKRGHTMTLEQWTVGGRGFGAKRVWDNLVRHNFQIDPLGPENLLVIAPGPLTGAYLPSSGKCSFVAVSPATGACGTPSRCIFPKM